MSAEQRYSDAIQFLMGRLNYERAPDMARTIQDFRLSRMEELLERLGNPQRDVPTVHIAGSKGKGSTATMVAEIARAAGYRSGLFTSPHVLRFEERMTINGQCPAPESVANLVDNLRPIVEQMDAAGSAPTFFELATAMGWIHFRTEDVDLAVMEVGLGGRLDSTNVCSPLATAITSISKDHTRLLGDTLEAIATEKAGIIKPGIPVVSGVRDPGPAAVIAERARRQGAELFQLGQDFSICARLSREAPLIRPPCFEFDYLAGDVAFEKLSLGMPGEHQTRNAAIALTLSRLIQHHLPRIDEDAIRTGLNAATCPLRVEVLGEQPLLIVDAAHNPASIQALCETIAPLSVRRKVGIFASSREKETAANLEILGSEFDEVILTRFLHNPRSMPELELTELADRKLACQWTWRDTPQQALGHAQTLASVDDLICATGSFFLAAEVKELLTNQFAVAASKDS